MTVLSSTKPVARKKHRCGTCGISIEPRTRYVNERILRDGHIYTDKSCLDCSALFGPVYDWVDPYMDEGIGPEDYVEWARANGEDPRAVAFLDRRGLS